MQNIKQGFKGTGIWPLNPQALAGKMGPSELFQNVSLPGIHDLGDCKLRYTKHLQKKKVQIVRKKYKKMLATLITKD
jgi:hypothetical protein